MMDEEEPSELGKRKLDWFEFETKMRKLIHELIEPTLRRAQEDREAVESIKRMTIDHGKRLEPIEIALYMSKSKHSLFEDMNMRIAEVEAERLKTAHDLRAEMEDLRIYIKNY